MGEKSRSKRERKLSLQQAETKKTFSGSAELDALMQPANSVRAAELVRSLLDGYPGSLDEDLVSFFSTAVREVHTAKMSTAIAERDIFKAGKPQAESVALSNFWAMQCLSELVGSHFDHTATYPPGLVGVFEWGVDGLHNYALDQARQLARVAMAIASWCVAEGHAEVTIVDSPLGGTVPAQVIAKVLEGEGIAVQLREFLAPRLPRHSEKYSIRDAAEKFAGDIKSQICPVFYPDEMISGSRFMNLYRALYKKLGARLIPIALEVHSWNTTTRDTAAKTANAVAELRKNTAGTASTLVHFRFPPSRRLTIDAGPPVIPNSPFYWGEVDLLAGKRKVNLVFDLINELRAISEAFKNTRSAAIITLHRLWSLDTNGTMIPDNLPYLQGVLPRMASQINWSNIESAARTDFSNEYVGKQPVLTQSHAIERLLWLKKEIVRDLDPVGFNNGKPSEAHVFANALHTLFDFGAHGRRLPRPKNRDYCEYTLTYGMPLAAINTKLVSLVVEEVAALKRYASAIAKTSRESSLTSRP
ncbi:hypothetical protein [Paraburkholderia azotifigens]|uniref:hypothetical protein n=1 Tax=Paraburkholderia azotifigens TaxID=2057004 RepID=UPI0038B987A2